MKIRLWAASLAAVGMMIGGVPTIEQSRSGDFSLNITSAARADEGHHGRIYWVRATSQEDAVTQILAIIVRGDEARFGSDRNYTSYAFNPVTRELRLNEVVRPIGVNKNHSVTTIVSLDTGMAVQRNEGGVIIARFQVGSEQMNGTAMLVQGLTSMLPALANGVGAATVTGLMSPCRGSGGCGGGSPTAIAISDSAANSIANSLLNNTGGCNSGCAPAATEPH